MKIRKGDTVLIVSGKDRRKKGKVLEVFPRDDRAVIEGANLRKKHVKPKRSGQKGQIIEMPFPIHLSNLKLICQKCGKPTRVGSKIKENKKFRVCKKCGQSL